MLQAYGRLQVYSMMGFFAFCMLALGNPIGTTGTWVGTLIMIGLGFWIELSEYYDDEEEDE